VSQNLVQGQDTRSRARTERGNAYSEVIIDSTTGDAGQAKERVIIPFKNENIYAKMEDGRWKRQGQGMFRPRLFLWARADMIKFLPL
jgi:hypothetical protein